ncbi:MAG: TIGR02281 family clan AA aspartic protease [Novosphingobium sp.]
MAALPDHIDFAAWLATLWESPLLAATLVAIGVAFLGSLIGRALPRLGRTLRTGGNLGLAAVLALGVVQFVRVAHPELDLALPQVGLPEQRVAGSETRVAMAADGHFWIRATVNGRRSRFLVDTGATLTALSDDLAEASGVMPDPARMPVQLRTANGAIAARLATIETLAFGNVVARDLDAVIAPGMNGMNVLGMNFLSRLKGWRVEDGVLILVPHHPQTGAPDV